jgi:phage I-like protein
MACEGCGRAWAKLREGYPGAAATEAARVLWWKARRGLTGEAKIEPPAAQDVKEGEGDGRS